jgi:DNA processing protein
MMGGDGRPPWWTPRIAAREVLSSLAATPGPLPAAVATRLAEGRDPASLLRAHSPDPAAVAGRLDALGLRLLVPGEDDWPLAANPPDPPCAWLFVAGPAPPGAASSVAVVGGRRASPLRRAAARSLGAGLARAGWCVVSGGAVGVDAAAHAGALDAGGRTVVVLGCGLDVPYPRANTGLFARVRAAGGTLASEHPPASQPRAANFLPRNRLIAALSAAVVVVEAAEDSGSLSTARAGAAAASAGSSSSQVPLGTRAPQAATSSSATAPPWSAASPTSSRSSAQPSAMAPPPAPVPGPASTLLPEPSSPP